MITKCRWSIRSERSRRSGGFAGRLAVHGEGTERDDLQHRRADAINIPDLVREVGQLRG